MTKANLDPTTITSALPGAAEAIETEERARDSAGTGVADAIGSVLDVASSAVDVGGVVIQGGAQVVGAVFEAIGSIFDLA